MLSTSAPGKVILLGEHAVVFGKPAIALAIDLRLRCRVSESKESIFNGMPFLPKHNPYVAEAINQYWKGGPLTIEIDSDLPSGSGLGSSAAVTVSFLAAINKMKGSLSEEQVARQGFDVESRVQGRASPIDTSVSSHGQGIFINSQPGEGLLWGIERDVRRWYIHHCPVPEMSMVVGFTGHKGPTGPLVAKVKRYVDHTRFARDVIDEIGDITLEGRECLRSGDVERLGRLMNRNHNLLAILGVSSPKLQKLVDAALPHSYGAKLTGAGGGGSMVALTDEPEKVAKAIKNRGGTPFIVHTGVDGVREERV